MTACAEPLAPARYLAELQVESMSLAAAARGDLAAAVPSCPGWSLADLVRHVGRVHRRAALMVRERAMSEASFSMVPVDDTDLIGWFEEGGQELWRALESAGPGSPVWNWTAGPQTAWFWFRRMAHETAVHRVDAQCALGRAAQVACDLAADGIDELTELFLPDELGHLPPGGIGGTLHLHQTDGDGEWLLALEQGLGDVSCRDGPADVTLAGPASDLVLFLWNRLGVEDLSVEGDAQVARRWGELLRW